MKTFLVYDETSSSNTEMHLLQLFFNARESPRDKYGPANYLPRVRPELLNDDDHTESFSYIN